MNDIFFEDNLSIIKRSNNKAFISALKRELKSKGIDLSVIDSFEKNKILKYPFYFTYKLLSFFTLPIVNKEIYYDLYFHCLVSSLYTYNFLTTQQKGIEEGKNMDLLYNITQNEIVSDKERDGMSSDNIKNKFDSLQTTNFKSLLNFYCKNKNNSRSIFCQNFLIKFTKIFDIHPFNRTYLKLNNTTSKNFTQSFKNGIPKLFSDYSELFSYCISDSFSDKNYENILYFYKLENVFHISLLEEKIEQVLTGKLELDRLKSLLKLPNVFSRANWDKAIPENQILHYLSDFLVPLFEKTFFAVLYICSNNNLTYVKDTLYSLLDCYYYPNEYSERIYFPHLDTTPPESFLTYANNYLYAKMDLFKPEKKENLQNFYKSLISKKYNLSIARGFGTLLHKIYKESLKNDFSFPKFLPQNLISHYFDLEHGDYSYITFRNSNIDYNKFSNYSYLDYIIKEFFFDYSKLCLESSNAKIKYTQFTTFKKTIMLFPPNTNFPSIANSNLDDTNLFLCNLIYGMKLLKYLPKNNIKDFFPDFIPLLNSAFDFINETEDYLYSKRRFFVSKPIPDDNLCLENHTSISSLFYSYFKYFLFIIFESNEHFNNCYKPFEEFDYELLSEKLKLLKNFIKKLEKHLESIYS